MPEMDIQLERSEILVLVQNVPGCYAVIDVNGGCLYVGSSLRLRTRLLSHYIDQRDGNGRRWRLSGVSEWYVRRDFAPEGCRLKIWETQRYKDKELELVREMAPTHNNLGLKQLNSTNNLSGRVFVPETSAHATIVGQTKDGECWRLSIDGTPPHIWKVYHKSRCQPVN
jgi:hypothetical protein